MSAEAAAQPLGHAITAQDKADAQRFAQIGIPLRFERNVGQIAGVAPAGTPYLGLGLGYTVRLAPGSVAVELPKGSGNTSGASSQAEALSLKLKDANRQAPITMENPLLDRDSYFEGRDASAWKIGIETYGRVAYRGVYPGVDVAFYGRGSRLEYDFVVSPGASTRRIRLNLGGMKTASLDAAGDLRLAMDSEAGAIELRLLKPVAYQVGRDGKTREVVAAGYRLENGKDVSFVLGKYDHSRELIIDPVLDYATYISSAYNDATAVAADAAGNSYLLLANSNQSSFTVLKFDPNGDLLQTGTVSLTYSGYYNTVVPMAIAPGPNGSVYVVGSSILGLPTTANAYQVSNQNASGGAGFNAFLAVFQPSGQALNLTYASYLGGVANSGYGPDYGFGLTVDAQGNAFVSGYAAGQNFPTTAGAYQTTYGANNSSGFVAKFNPLLSGTASLVYSTLLGPSGPYLNSIAIDGSGDAYVATSDASGGTFPTTSGAFHYSGVNTSGNGAYVTELNPAGSQLVYSAYLGPIEQGGYYSVGIAVDGSGDAYVTSAAGAQDFPTTAGAYQTAYPGAFVSELNPTGTGLVYSTFLTGPSSGTNYALVLPVTISIPAGCSSACNAYVTGRTSAADFPAINAIQSYAGASTEAFAVELTGSGTAAVFSTYLGGFQSSETLPSFYYYGQTPSPNGALDGSGDLYMAGNLNQSVDFPVTPAPAGPASPGGGYLAKIGPASAANVVAVPNSYVFGTQPVGVSSTVYPGGPTPILLRNMGTQAVSSLSFSFTPASEFGESDNCGGATAGGTYCTVNVTFTPVSSGPQSGTMTVAANGTTLATVALSGTGEDVSFVTATPSTLSFGDVVTGTTSPAQTVTFTNVGDAPAAMGLSLNTSTGFTEQNNCPAQLQPSQSCQASVKFVPLSTGQAATTLSQYSGFAGSYANVSLSGQGVVSGTGGSGTLALSSTGLNFGTQVDGTTSAVQSFNIVNTGTVPVAISSIATTLTSAQGGTTDFQISYVYVQDCCYPSAPYQFQLEPGSYAIVYVTFAPSAAAAETANLNVSSTVSSTPQSVALSGIGLAAAQALEFIPGTQTFLDQPIGVPSSSQTFYVYSTGTAPVTIDRALITGDFQISGDRCSATTVTPPSAPGLESGGNYCYINVTFTPTEVGPRTGTLTLIDSATGNSQVLNLAGSGIPVAAGQLTANASSLVFPAQLQGTTSNPQLVTISNSGNAALTVNSFSTSDNFSVSTNTCPTTPFQMNAGGSCTLAVTFTPMSSSVTPLTGTLTIASTTGNQAVSLSGTGQAATQAIGFTPSVASFGPITYGTTSYIMQTFVRSTGTQAVTFNSAPSVSGPFAVVNDQCTPYNAIAAGQSCEIDLTYTPTGSSSSDTGSMTLSTSAGNEALQLNGSGIANTPDGTLSPAVLDFTQQQVNSGFSSQQPITFTYNASTSLTVNSVQVTAGSANFVIQSGADGCTGQQLTQSATCTVNMTFAPTQTGYDVGTVTFTTTDGTYTASLAGFAPAAQDSAYVSPTTVVFPPQNVNTQSSLQQILFFNTGGANLTLGTVFGSNFGSTAEFGLNTGVGPDNCSGTTVIPGGSCYVDVEFTPSAAGSRNGTAVFPITFADGTTGSQVAALTGVGIAQYNEAVLTPSILSFTDQVLGTTSGPQLVYLTNNGNEPFTLGTVTGTNYGAGQVFSPITNGDTCSGQTLSPGTSCYVEVQFAPTALGAANSTLVFPVTYFGASSATNVTATLTGNGVAVSNQAVLTPATLNFGPVALNITSTYMGTMLTNMGNTPWTVGTVTGSNYGTGQVFTLPVPAYDGCSGTTIQPGSSCTVYVQFTPVSTISYTGSLVFPVTYQSAASPVNFTATLAGMGLAASQDMAFSQSTVAFGGQPVNTSSASANVLLVNRSGGNVIVNSITLGGSNPGDFTESDNCNGTTLSTNSYCTVTVSFTPASTSLGSRSASIVEKDSITTGSHTLNLTGTGTADTPTVSFYPSSLTFSSSQTVAQGSAPQNVSVTNNGDATLNITQVASSDSVEFPVVQDGCTGQSLAQFSSCIISVAFSPNTTGTLSATIGVTDNASGSPQKLNLTGGGTAQLTSTTTLAANPTSGAFGTAVTLTATVVDQNSSPLTNGRVTFLNGTKTLGTVQVVRTTSGGGVVGTATLKTLALP
ncbi:MAG TPA: choice-of-anchor D domain-containing protein, partial [Terracidiphilus sp.]|nr:choice-of-anchor D domain-containing protein [Terracidiphilus sp.]